MYEMQMSVANMPSNAIYSESDRAKTLSEPEGSTAIWTAEKSDSARDEKLEMQSKSGTAELELPGGLRVEQLSQRFEVKMRVAQLS